MNVSSQNDGPFIVGAMELHVVLCQVDFNVLIFFMGWLLSRLLLAPCVIPLLAGAIPSVISY